ncbi:hypothetical protein REJC140_03850 [Pseudorhizobium endolithicum]|uniref:Virion structural protein n=1 Tax=Pseudorhizobium endolithicum TaxID=1191678 RepID=A0ABM8PRN6_9HYPH|nr:hypothetical protein [Pseudorhizobium endolithicum]CAD7044665.1 hypothetical protein REJC140_03850 [Pseudorhizobium endolithicum]
MINIDIHTKVIGSDTSIFVARPGRNYRFFQRFVDHNFVGPDLPGLDLPPFTEIDDVEDLEERVKRSFELRRYFTRGERDIDYPSLDLASYEDTATSRSTAQIVRVVRAYFGGMKKGDIVIVPPAPFRSMAQIGELTTEPNDVRSLNIEMYEGRPLSGRYVRWLASIEKAKLPPQTLDALQKPSPLISLIKPAWPAIFRRAYGSYMTSDEYGARFEVTSDRFQTNDDFLIQAFFNFVAANFDRVEKEASVYDFYNGAFSAEDVAPDLYTNVNSPGGISLKSAVAIPIVIATMLNIAITVGPDAHAAAVNDQITFGNSQAPPNDPCTALVRRQVVTQLTLLGYDKWAIACQNARAAAVRTGISSSVEVKP